MKNLIYVLLCSVLASAGLCGCAPAVTPTVVPTFTPVLSDAILSGIDQGGRVEQIVDEQQVELEVGDTLFNGDVIRAYEAQATLVCLKTRETLRVPVERNYTVRCAIRALPTMDPCSSQVASQIPYIFARKGRPIEPPACLPHPENLPFIIEELGYDPEFSLLILANANFSYGLFYLGQDNQEEASYSLWKSYELYQGLGFLGDAYEVKAIIDEYDLSRPY